MAIKETIYPDFLFHGSRFKQNKIMPGYKRTGEIVHWDKTESNEFLYATTEKNVAIELGFASSLEKCFNLERFSVKQNKIIIEIQDKILYRDLESLPVFVYVIQYRNEDGWIKNNNQYNDITTEYKTKQIITEITDCESINVKQWLKQYEVVIVYIRSFDKNNENNKNVSLESEKPSYLLW